MSNNDASYAFMAVCLENLGSITSSIWTCAKDVKLSHTMPLL